MTRLDDFERRLEEGLAAAEQGRLRQAREREAAMAALEADGAAFARIAAALDQRVIRPRVEALAARFGNARVECGCATPAGIHARCAFAHTDRFPAAVTLVAGVLHDREKRAASVYYSVEITPMLFQYEKGAHLDLPLDGADEAAAAAAAAAAAWLEERLLTFLATYLRLEGDANYQRANRHVDPVCGMEVSAGQVAHRAEHARRTFYFCSQACRDKFAAAPDFYAAHRAATALG